MARDLQKLVWALIFVGTAHASSCPWTHAWEWQGVFHVHEGGMLVWSAEKNEKATYADQSMKMVIRTTSSATALGLEAAEEAAQSAWNGSFQTAQPGEVLRPNNAYNLIFDTSAWVSLFKIQSTPETNIAIFAEHLPTEFENRFHYFIAADNKEIEPAYEASESDCHSVTASVSMDRSGEVVLGSILVMLPTLLGVLFVLKGCPGAMEMMQKFMPFMNAAASGVLVAVAVFLILPEAHHLLASAGEAESAAIWGSSIICGWLMGVLSVMLSFMIRRLCSKPAESQQVDLETESEGSDQSKSINTASEELMTRKWLIALPVELGDWFHNFADGLVIGIAFRYCDTSFAWKIVGISVAHELPQELADLHVLINKAGLHWTTATLFNVFSGSAVLLGACLTYFVDIGMEAEGLLLALGAGVFLFVGMTQLGAGMIEETGSKKPCLEMLGTLLCFVLGAVCIGLILIDHEHCAAPVADGEVNPHAGHGH